MEAVKLSDVSVKLVGEDGNAFSIMGRVTKAMKRAGHSDLVEEYRKEAMSGDYDKLLQVTMAWVNCDPYSDSLTEEEADAEWDEHWAESV